MTEIIHIKRDNTETPFGFKLQGGADFSIPLSILQVTDNSIAQRSGLRAGDVIIKINDMETQWMDHARAKQEIIRAGNEFILTVQRDGVDITSKPSYTPLTELKCLTPQNVSTYSSPPVQKTDLRVEKENPIKIGSSHNRAPMPFNKNVGSSVCYQSAKATNWEPGDYTKFNKKPEPAKQQSQPSPTVTAVFHNPYNTPIGLYSDANVFDAFSHQTKNIINPDLAAKAKNNNNSQQATIKQQPAPQAQPAPQQPRGASSLSMRMLNSALEASEGTPNAPPSVFDLKDGNNPTGATIPKGFRSVNAPTLPSPEDIHRPMHKEYEVKHVKQNWVEPKIN